MPIKFKFRWIPFMAVAVAAAIGVSLGQWQLRRAADKQVIERSMAERETMPPVDMTDYTEDANIAYRKVRVKGRFVEAWPVYLDNRPYQGKAGLYVLMPFRMAGGDSHVLVARGWVPRDNADRTRVPDLKTPSGEIVIEGRAISHMPRVMQLGQKPPLKPGVIVQNVDATELSPAAKMMLLPFIIEQSSDTGDGLVRDWPRPSSGIDKHRGYAVQWFGLAATAIVFFIVTGFRRGRS